MFQKNKKNMALFIKCDKLLNVAGNLVNGKVALSGKFFDAGMGISHPD